MLGLQPELNGRLVLPGGICGHLLGCLPWPFTDAWDTPAVAAAHAANGGVSNANIANTKTSTHRLGVEPRPASRSPTTHRNPETANPHVGADTLVHWPDSPGTGTSTT